MRCCLNIIRTVFIIVGSIVITVGFAIDAYINKQKAKCTETVTATVIELAQKQDNEDRSTLYAPVFEKGDETELKINPDNPKKEFYAPKDDWSKLVKYILWGVGGFFIFLGIIFHVVYHVYKNKFEQGIQDGNFDSIRW